MTQPTFEHNEELPPECFAGRSEAYVHLIVDGHKFTARKSVLQQIPIFETVLAMIKDERGQKVTSPLFLDRNFKRFQQIYMKFANPSYVPNVTKSIESELTYYGVSDCAPENSDCGAKTVVLGNVLKRAKFEVENMLFHEPFYVDACGTLFITTRERLAGVLFFEKMFAGTWKESDVTVGTKDHSFFIEIPPIAFKSILKWARNEDETIPREYMPLMSMFCWEEKDKRVTSHRSTDHPSPTPKESTGALLQLIGTRVPEIYFTTDPEISFFKETYQRYTRFSSIIVNIDPFSNKNVDWGQKIEFTIQKQADMIQNVYLKVRIKGDFDIFWKPDAMYRIISKVELEINEQLIDMHYGWMLWQWEHLFEKQPWHSIPITCENNEFIVPLRFFFTHSIGMSFPLIALKFHKVKIYVTLNGFKNCAFGNTNVTPPVKVSLDVMYHHLDTYERKRMAETSHELLIRQVKCHRYENIDNEQQISINLGDARRWEILVWTLHTQDNDELFCGYDGNPTQDALVTARIMIDGHERTNYNAYYYRVTDKYNHQMRIPQIPIYTYSFADRPDMKIMQPSGNLNSNAKMILKLVTKPGVKYVKVWAVKFNMLRVMAGMAGLAYSERV